MGDVLGVEHLDGWNSMGAMWPWKPLALRETGERDRAGVDAPSFSFGWCRGGGRRLAGPAREHIRPIRACRRPAYSITRQGKDLCFYWDRSSSYAMDFIRSE